jgi:acetyltransferase-like isoleucine patch superfamily enzyme
LTGAKIGKECFLDPGTSGFFEIDNMHIGNGTIALIPNIHGHFVNHNQLQFAPVMLRCNVRVNDGATVMPFTTVGDNITLLSQCTTTMG